MSRDIHELRLVKTAEGYKLPQGEVAEAFLPSIERLIHEFVYEVKTAQNLVVVKTSAGSAQPVSAAIDAEEWDEVVGTIGGDDTILVIAHDARVAEKLASEFGHISRKVRLFCGHTVNKNEGRPTTRGLRRHRLFRLGAGASARTSRRSQEAAALPAQRRERRHARLERSVSATGGQRRISLRDVSPGSG